MVSVIIPVYNSEKYIARCLDSLRGQSYGDWEAVCVDDGSSDGTAGILNRYAGEDARIRVLHVENGGVSRARNLALEMARGEFLLFVDSDDFIHPQTMEICVGLAGKNGSDIVAFTYNRSYRTKNMIRQLLHLGENGKVGFRKYVPEEIEFRDTDDIFDYATEYSSPEGIERKWAVKHCQPWRCLYRSSKVRDIRFIEGIIYEDFPWWSEVMLRVKTATIINLPLYFYYPNLGSYINSSASEFKVRSLRVAVRAAEELYARAASPQQLVKWERNFLGPFRDKLRKKEAGLKR